MRPIADVIAWHQQQHALDVHLYSGDIEGGFMKGHLSDQEAREVIAGQRADDGTDDADDQESADRWDHARVWRGHLRRYLCLTGCGEHDPGRGWHISRSEPGRGAFLGTEVTL